MRCNACADGRCPLCVPTDVAGRGIDLPILELVIHAETLPRPTRQTLMPPLGAEGRADARRLGGWWSRAKTRAKRDVLLKFAKITGEWALPPSLTRCAPRIEGPP